MFRKVRRSIAAVVVLAVLAGCSSDSEGTDGRRSTSSSTSTEVDAETAPAHAVVEEGSGAEVTFGGATVVVPAGAAEVGARLSISGGGEGGNGERFPGQVFDIELSSELTTPAIISVPFEADLVPDGQTPMLYTWLAESERWLPQAATVEGETLVAETMHLSRWTWGQPYYLWATVTGDRTTPPVCSGGLPGWISSFDHQDDVNATVLSCAEGDGDRVRVKLRANRGVPVLVEFSRNATLVDGSLESQQMSRFVQERWPNRAYIGAKQELIVTFDQPERAEVITARRWGGAPARYAVYAITFFYEQVIVGSPNLVGRGLEIATCLWDTGQFLESEEPTNLGATLDALTSCIDDKLDALLASGALSQVDHRRLAQAFAYWKFADEFTKAVDTTYFDSNDTYDYFGIATRRPDVCQSSAMSAAVVAAGSREPDEIRGLRCAQGWAIATVVDPITGDTDGLTLFRLDGEQWNLVGDLVPGCPSEAERLGAPTDVAAELLGDPDGCEEPVSTFPPSAPSAPAAETGPGEFTVEFTHPAWGPVRLLTTDADNNGPGPASLSVIDANGVERYRYENEAMYTFRPVGTTEDLPDQLDFRPIDVQGHIFIDFNPGRYNGVVALRPTADGFDDFDTLPDPDDYDGRFYSAEVSDQEGDGTYEIALSINDCTPSCADGTTTTTTYRWNGSDYVA